MSDTLNEIGQLEPNISRSQAIEVQIAPSYYRVKMEIYMALIDAYILYKDLDISARLGSTDIRRAFSQLDSCHRHLGNAIAYMLP